VLEYGAVADFEAWRVDGTYPARHARGRNLHACDRKRERPPSSLKAGAHKRTTAT
jgi:hypothetical protein